jgi:restriction endonuclease S subunit
MQKAISQIAQIKTGFPGQPEKDGTIPFLQLRQYNEDGIMVSNDAELLKLDEKSKPHLLKNGDVLLVAKGNRLFATVFEDESIPTVASSSFFVITPNPKFIYPAYLAAILNAPQTKTALIQLGAGTNIFSLRKSELEAFEIPVLPLAKQNKIAALAALHQQQIQLAKQIITQKQELYKAIISQSIKF